MIKTRLINCIGTIVVLGMAVGLLLTSGCKFIGKDDDCGEHICYDPPLVTLYLVPMDGMTEKQVKKLGEEFLEKFASQQSQPFNIEVLPHIDTPVGCMNEAKTRLRADSIIRLLNRNYKESCRKNAADLDAGNGKYHVMGVTNRDISTTVHGKPDYGILGLSYLRGPHVGVVSTYRLRNKNDLWKLTAHEFCHGFFGLPHCKNDDQSCLMADAKGGNPHFELKDSLCSDCANRCVIEY